MTTYNTHGRRAQGVLTAELSMKLSNSTDGVLVSIRWIGCAGFFKRWFWTQSAKVFLRQQVYCCARISKTGNGLIVHVYCEARWLSRTLVCCENVFCFTLSVLLSSSSVWVLLLPNSSCCLTKWTGFDPCLCFLKRCRWVDDEEGVDLHHLLSSSVSVMLLVELFWHTAAMRWVSCLDY